MPDDLPEPTARYVGGAGAGPRAGEHVVAPKNRWARAILGFRDLVPEAWYTLDVTLSWDEDEQAAAAHDFALVGFDFMARDGSSLDVESVPGLVRTLPDPLGAWLPGPAYHATTGLSAEWRCGFRMPPRRAISPSASGPGATRRPSASRACACDWSRRRPSPHRGRACASARRR